MKTASFLTTLSIAALLSGVFPAVSGLSAKATGANLDEPHERPGFRGAREQGPGGPMAREPVEEWMQRLREDDPEEYERMEELRQSDPAAFRDALRERVRRRRMLHELRRQHPQLHEFMIRQPRHEREGMMRTLMRHSTRETRPDWMPARHPGFPSCPETQDIVKEMRSLLDAYRTEPDPEKREALAEALRTHVEELYDIREQQQLERIRWMEERLHRLKKEWETQREQRDQLVEEYLEQLLRSAPERLFMGP